MEEEINENKQNNILNIDKENPIRDINQTSFSDYFIKNLKELPSFFINYSTPSKDLNIKRFLS